MANKIFAGGTTFAGSVWSGSALVDYGTSADDYFVAEGSQTINAGLDFSGLTDGIQSFTVGPNFTGNIGSPTAGNFEVDIDQGTPVAKYLASAGTFYAEAAGNSNVWTRLVGNTGGAMYFGGGTITTLEWQRGTFSADASTVIATAHLWGGSGTFAYNSTGFTACHIYGGTWTTRRGGVYNVGPGARLIVDLDAAGPTTTIVVNGGTIEHVNGNVANFTGNSGRYTDMLKSPATIGGSSGTLGPADVFRMNYGSQLTVSATQLGEVVSYAGDWQSLTR